MTKGRQHILVLTSLFALALSASACGGGGGGGGGDGSIEPQATAQAGVFNVTLGWTEVAGAVSYNIYWNNTGSVSASDNRIAEAIPPYVHSGISPFKTYHYLVTAVDDGGLETVVGQETSARPVIPCPNRKLVASDPQTNDYFGHSVAISGDLAIVGAVFEDMAGTTSGAAYVYYRNQGGTDSWGQAAKLTASDAAAGDEFGYSVAISGDFAIVGARSKDGGSMYAGAAYVFYRNQGGTDAWGQAAKLTASDAQEADSFGAAVAISGDYAVVGAYLKTGAGPASGAAYVFSRNQGGADHWGQAAKLTASDAQEAAYFGVSVGISGDHAIVGAYGADNQTYAGAAYVYRRDQGGTDHWGQAAKLTASDAQASDYFGISVAISEDLAIVGAHNQSGGTGAGAAYVYDRNLGGTEAWGQAAKLTASDAEPGDRFGVSVSLDGEYAVVGADCEDVGGTDAGAAYVYHRNRGGAGTWGQVRKLTAPDAQAGDSFGWAVAISDDYVIVGAFGKDTGGSDAGAAYFSYFDPYRRKLAASVLPAYDYFGISVAISGDYAIVGASYESSAGLRAGAAYVYYRNQGGIDVWGQAAKLTASDAQAEDYFGGSVAISGDYAIVGAHQEDGGGTDYGAAYVFYRNQGGADAWGQVKKLSASDAQDNDNFGGSVAISGDNAIVGASGEDDGGTHAGAAYVFGRNQGGTDTWGQVVKLTASDSQASDSFGGSVSISGDYAMAGAFGEDDGGTDAGAAYIFSRNQGGADAWGQAAKLTASDAQAGDNFGLSVALDGDHAVAGAYGEDTGGTNAGAAYIFGRNQGGADAWGQVVKLTASDAQAGDGFGLSVSLDGDHAVVGAYGADDGGTDAGAAYVFDRNQGGTDAWGQAVRLKSWDLPPRDHFGVSVAISSGHAIAGALNPDTAMWGATAVYIF